MSDVNFLLFFKGDSDSGGAEASVRGFYSIDAARAAMQEAYKKMADAVRLPAPFGAYCDRYTVKMRNCIKLAYRGDQFLWEIIEAVPEDREHAAVAADLSGNHSWHPATYTVTVKDLVTLATSVFSMDAYNIFCAIETAEERYERAISKGRYPEAGKCLITAQDSETGEKTEWKEFYPNRKGGLS